MAERVCDGLPGDWLNGWLAAVGATVLSDAIQLRWTTDTVPVAVLAVAADDDPVDELARSWPDDERLERMPIANEWSGLARMGRKVPVGVFVERARAARSHIDSWTISSTLTDLHVDTSGEVAHARLDPPVPRGITLYDRLVQAHKVVQPSSERIRATLGGEGPRVAVNGLGFDLTRVTSQADGSKNLVDPAVEVLAFYGLSLLPVRGSGVDLATHHSRARDFERQRGWQERGSKDGDRLCFRWPVWRQPLDIRGIDALLDVWHGSLLDRRAAKSGSDRPRRDRKYWDRLGVQAAWQTISYTPRVRADVTRGYGSERL